MTISIHAPLTGRDGRYWQDRISDPYFNPRAPYGARRGRLPRFGSVLHISIHAPLTGRDSMICKRGIRLSAFQSTRPLRGATQGAAYFYLLLLISIHAPLTGRDELECSTTCAFFNFNPRAPYGARPIVRQGMQYRTAFQSTRPLRGATSYRPPVPSGLRFQSTRPLRGATVIDDDTSRDELISIHAPLTGRDLRATVRTILRKRFQSTRPLRGATSGLTISTNRLHNFNPRAPYGARLCRRYCGRGNLDFNPRAPYGARHSITINVVRAKAISIHAPLTGRDSKNAQIISCTFVITDNLSRKSTCIALSARMLFRNI